MIEAGKIKQEENKIDSFILVIESKNEFDIYGDSANVHIKNDKIETRRYAMYVLAPNLYKQATDLKHISYSNYNKREFTASGAGVV